MVSWYVDACLTLKLIPAKQFTFEDVTHYLMNSFEADWVQLRLLLFSFGWCKFERHRRAAVVMLPME